MTAERLSVAVILLAILVAAALIFIQQQYYDPLKEVQDLSKPCTTRITATLPNEHGLVASVRETFCSGARDGELVYFVFVHPRVAMNTNENLVFSYFADTLPKVKPPAVRWASTGELHVSANCILRVTSQRYATARITVRYELSFHGFFSDHC